MKSSDGNSLKYGNIGRVGRQEGNKMKKAREIVGEENIITLFNMQLDLAMNSPNEDTRAKCGQFLLNKTNSNPAQLAPLPNRTYIEIPLLPMGTIENIRENEDTICKHIANGSLSLEEGKELFSITEQARKSWECTEGVRLREEMQQMLEEVKSRS